MPDSAEQLQRIYLAGFELQTFERYPKCIGVVRDGCVALLVPGVDGLQILGTPGWRMGEVMGVLTEREGRKVFQAKSEVVEATPERLARLYTEFPNFGSKALPKFWVSPPEYLELRRDLKSWESIEGWRVSGANVAGGNEPARVTISSVTGGLLSQLGVQPVHGRILTPQDDVPGAPRAAVLAYGFWKRAAS